MRDIPLFTTENGMASLTLSEIPYKKTAYIRLQASQDPEALLQECIDFCRACGAEMVFATGHKILDDYSLHTEIWQMQCQRALLPDTDAALFPVQVETLELWREHYNKRMMYVPNAATMTQAAGEKLLKDGNGYFVHRGDNLLGIGIASSDRIDAVASLIPGSGREIVCALNHALCGETVTVEVASENTRAVALYESLGFLKTVLISKWFQVL